MLLSIIIPAYNVEKYISTCISKIARKKIKNNYEIIIINDGSIDNTWKIMCQYKDDNIVLVNKEKNSGLSDTRNIGLQIANGKYVMFLDADDYFEENALAQLENIIEKFTSADVIYMGYYIEKDNSKYKRYDFKSKTNKVFKSDEFLLNELKCRNIPVPACFAIYKRSFLIENEIRFEIGLLHEDELWTPSVLLKANTIATTDLCIYHYIIRENSITQKKDKTQNGLDLIYICNELIKMSAEIDNKEIKKYMLNHIAMLYMKAMCIGKLYRKEYKKNINKKIPLKYSFFFKDKIKATVFLFNLRIYYILDCWMGHRI